MATISLRVDDSDYKLLQAYTSANGMSLSAFIREAALDRIENDFALDEARILKAREEAQKGKKYTFEEAWQEVGV